MVKSEMINHTLKGINPERQRSACRGLLQEPSVPLIFVLDSSSWLQQQNLPSKEDCLGHWTDTRRHWHHQKHAEKRLYVVVQDSIGGLPLPLDFDCKPNSQHSRTRLCSHRSISTPTRIQVPICNVQHREENLRFVRDIFQATLQNSRFLHMAMESPRARAHPSYTSRILSAPGIPFCNTRTTQRAVVVTSPVI